MNSNNLLCDLAKAMPARDRHQTAVALRCLARHGFTSLDAIEQATDCELLAVSGIGIERLGAVRRLTQPQWQPPSRTAINLAGRFLWASQLALRYWRVEDLEGVFDGDYPTTSPGAPLEARLSLDAYRQAVQEAVPHHGPAGLRHILRRANAIVNPKSNGRPQ